MAPPGGDVLAEDVQRALGALHGEFGHAYRITWYAGLYCAARKGPSGQVTGQPLSGETPAEIGQAIRADWGEEP